MVQRAIFWMGVEFVAAVQIIIYVMVLRYHFSFSSLSNGEEMPKPLRTVLFFGIIVWIAFTYHLIYQ
jgi:NADH:ubiquinone oxidoreductase subunit 6 (subunit J)